MGSSWLLMFLSLTMAETADLDKIEGCLMRSIDEIKECLGADPIQWARAREKSFLTMRMKQMKAEVAKPWWDAGDTRGSMVQGLMVTCPDDKVFPGTGKVCTHQSYQLYICIILAIYIFNPKLYKFTAEHSK